MLKIRVHITLSEALAAGSSQYGTRVVELDDTDVARLSFAARAELVESDNRDAKGLIDVHHMDRDGSVIDSAYTTSLDVQIPSVECVCAALEVRAYERARRVAAAKQKREARIQAMLDKPDDDWIRPSSDTSDDAPHMTSLQYFMNLTAADCNDSRIVARYEHILVMTFPSRIAAWQERREARIQAALAVPIEQWLDEALSSEPRYRGPHEDLTDEQRKDPRIVKRRAQASELLESRLAAKRAENERVEQERLELECAAQRSVLTTDEQRERFDAGVLPEKELLACARAAWIPDLGPRYAKLVEDDVIHAEQCTHSPRLKFESAACEDGPWTSEQWAAIKHARELCAPLGDCKSTPMRHAVTCPVCKKQAVRYGVCARVERAGLTVQREFALPPISETDENRQTQAFGMAIEALDEVRYGFGRLESFMAAQLKFMQANPELAREYEAMLIKASATAAKVLFPEAPQDAESSSPHVKFPDMSEMCDQFAYGMLALEELRKTLLALDAVRSI